MGILSLLTVITKILDLGSVLYPFLQSTWCRKKEKIFAADQFLSNYQYFPFNNLGLFC